MAKKGENISPDINTVSDINPEIVDSFEVQEDIEVQHKVDLASLANLGGDQSTSQRYNESLHENLGADDLVHRPIPRRTPVPRSEDLISCLRDETIIVRHLPKQKGIVQDPKHPLYGGLADGATRSFVVPIYQSNGAYVSVLTKEEMRALEYEMNLQPNALSVHAKFDNYWDNRYVKLSKGDNILRLSSPEDYIAWKILLANVDQICPSMQAYQDMPKDTYEFVIISQKDENKVSQDNMTYTMRAYKVFGSIERDKAKLKYLLEILDGRPVSPRSSLEEIQSAINILIQKDPKMFCALTEDPLLDTRVLIGRCVECRLIRKVGEFYYLAKDNSPLADSGFDSTMTNASKYLSHPRNQELKFSLEAKLKTLIVE